MSVAIYFILSFLGSSSQYFNSTYCSNIILFALLIPIIDFLVLTFRHRKITLFNLARSSSFLLIGITNYYSARFIEMPFKYFIFGWIIVAFVISVYLKRKSYEKYIVRWVIYSLLMCLAIFNSSLSNLQRLDLFTLEDPIYSSKIKTDRLCEFAYIYYQNDDKSMAIFLMNKALDNINRRFSEDEINQKNNREKLVKEHKQVKNNLILLLQNKWVIKGRFIE